MARRAGHTPKVTPTTSERPIADAIAQVGGDADADAERRQRGAQPVAGDRAEHEAEQVDGFDAASRSGTARGRVRRAHRRASATTGSRRVARRAGHTPNATPTATERPSAAATAHPGGDAGKLG